MLTTIAPAANGSSPFSSEATVNDTTAVGAVVAGLTHFQLTDDASDADTAREGTEGGDVDVGRANACFLVDALLPGGLGEDPGVLVTPSVWPTGLVTWQAGLAAADTDGSTP